jgi:hypothetical protein
LSTNRLIFFWPAWILGTRVDGSEPSNCFITLFTTLCWSWFDQFLWRICREKTPSVGIYIFLFQLICFILHTLLPFVSWNKAIPSTGTKWINMNASATTSRSHHKPTVWRSSWFTHQFKKIISEICRYLVVIEKLSTTRMLKKNKKNLSNYLIQVIFYFALTSPKLLSNI